MISIEIIYQEVINLLFGLPFLYLNICLLYLNILKTEKILQFWDKKILDMRGTSFQRKRLNGSNRYLKLHEHAIVHILSYCYFLM